MIFILEPDSELDSKLGLIQQKKVSIQLNNAQSVLVRFCLLNNDKMYFILIKSFNP